MTLLNFPTKMGVLGLTPSSFPSPNFSKVRFSFTIFRLCSFPCLQLPGIFLQNPNFLNAAGCEHFLHSLPETADTSWGKECHSFYLALTCCLCCLMLETRINDTSNCNCNIWFFQCLGCMYKYAFSICFFQIQKLFFLQTIFNIGKVRTTWGKCRQLLWPVEKYFQAHNSRQIYVDPYLLTDPV